MDARNIKKILDAVKYGRMKVEEAIEKLRHLPYEDIGFAQIDHHRQLRQGFPEVIFCKGKSIEQVVEIVERMLEKKSDILATRADLNIYKAVKAIDPRARYNDLGMTIVIENKKKELTKGKILIVTAGTSDIPVAEEAKVTAEVLGSSTESLYDVGVAGIHRLLDKKEMLHNARVIIVIAGMDGALASVVGGLTDKPIIAVPTSSGYGTSFSGISALLAMLNSCAPGLSTVNIDNGFGAACIAHRINILGEHK
ncbi:MAG: nickel pincer cofactor biosynthesis protein LarB [Nitrospirae bacterium]|nr:nickel pincer cofactor biosynthesis protein LarB [Nitrospirota bacterium]